MTTYKNEVLIAKAKRMRSEMIHDFLVRAVRVPASLIAGAHKRSEGHAPQAT